MKRWFVMLAFVLAVQGEAAEAPLVAHDAWVRATPPGVDRSAGYLVLENPSDAPVRVAAAHCEGAARTMLHETVRLPDGREQMRHVQGWDVPPHGKLVLAPGGRHLMLMQLARPLREGDAITCTLLTDRGKLTVRFAVRR